MKLSTEVGLGPCHTVLDGDPAPSNLRPMSVVACGQMAAWIKMPLGMEVGLGPGDFVLDGDRAPPKKGQSPAIFGPWSFWPNGWVDQDATLYGNSSRPRRHCVRWGLGTQLTLKGTQCPPFSAHAYCGQTAGWIKMQLGTEVGLANLQPGNKDGCSYFGAS